MNYSDVNDVMREGMAAAARWFADTNGSLVTTGTGGTLAVATNRADLTLSSTLLLVVTIGDSATTSLVGAELTVTPFGGSALTTKDIVTLEGVQILRRHLTEGLRLVLAYDATFDAFISIGGQADAYIRPDSGLPLDTEIGNTSGSIMKLKTTSVSNRPQVYFDNVDTDEVVTVGNAMQVIEIESGDDSLVLDRRHSGCVVRITPGASNATNIHLSADFSAVPGGWFILDHRDATDGFLIFITLDGGGTSRNFSAGSAQGVSRCIINYGSGSSGFLEFLWITFDP